MKLILFSGLILINSCLFAQDSIGFFKSKHEINIGFLNILTLGNTSDFGIGYKLGFGSSAIRVRTDFYYYESLRTSSGQSQESSTLRFAPKAGFELHLNLKKSMVFYGLDFCLSYEENKQTTTSGNYSYLGIYKGIGVSPLIGYKFLLSKHISISTETSFDFLYTKQSQSYFQGENQINTGNEAKLIKASLRPFGMFSINFFF